MATSLVPCTINRFTKLVQWSFQERLCKISCINEVCLATSSVICITNDNASHPSAHITVGVVHNTLRISAILNAPKHKHFSMNFWTKAHSWTLKPAPFSSSAYTPPRAILTHFFNKLHRLMLFPVYPQRTPRQHSLPAPGLESSQWSTLPTAPPAKGFPQPLAPGTPWFQGPASQHHPRSPSEAAPRVTKYNHLKALFKIQAVLVIP